MNQAIKLLHLLAIVAIALVLTSVSREAAAGNCLFNGGKVNCTAAIPTSDWNYSLCDDAGAYVYRRAAWCTVLGGTWDANIVGCLNPTVPVSPANASGLAGQFENIVHGPSCGSGPPPGACSDWNCKCAAEYSNGVLTADYSTMPFSGMMPDSLNNCTQPWAENVILNMSRTAGCPDGYVMSSGLIGSGDPAYPCYKPQPCLECAGNPIDLGNGTKYQRENDYAAAAPGGVSFSRFFNSSGFFEPTSRRETPSDKWRHTYAARIVAFDGNAYLMAAAQRADGLVRYFDPNGVEMLNVDGAAYRLQKLVDGAGNVTGWRLTTAESDVETYDAPGRLTSVTTRAGFVTTLVYNATGQLASVTDAFGRALTFTYDDLGRMATMTDPSTRLYRYGYDSRDNPTSVTLPDGSVRSYLYEDAAHPLLLTGIVDERGARFATYSYDTSGRGFTTEHAGQENKFTLNLSFDGSTYTTRVTDGFNTDHMYFFKVVNGALKKTSDYVLPFSNGFYYDANGNLTSAVDYRGTSTTYVFDSARALETSRTEASGTPQARTITTTWHPTYRLPATITEPSGVAGVNLVTTYTYDPSGNVTKKNLTAGSVVREWNYTYNARGQVLTVDGPRTDVSDVTTITYFDDTDACTGCRGNVHTVTNAAGHVTTFDAYDADGRPTQITDANGAVTTLGYTPRGWLASRSVAGETTTYDHDVVGNLTKVTLPDGPWVHYIYDAANAVVAVDDALGNSIEYELDVKGNRVQESVYDPQQQLGRTLQRVYDGQNRLQREVGAAAQTTAYTFDANSNVLTVTDPLQRVTTNTYDALNRLTNVKDTANGNTVFTYDARDRLTSVKDPKLSAATTYAYNGLGDLLTQVSPDTGTTSFTFDAAGNVATQTDARSIATAYTYDALNRVTAATVTDGTLGYEYDNTATGGPYAKGRLTRVTDPSGFTTYAYDAQGRVTSKIQTVNASPTNKAFTTTYGFASGRLGSLTYPSGRTVTYGFDGQGHVNSISVDGVSVLAAAEYFPFGAVKKWTWANGQVYERSQDLDGQVSSFTLGPATATYADLSQAFGYDALNRLTTADLAAGQSQAFAYDANGNRTSATVNGAATTYTYPTTSHRLTSLSGATTRSFTYDNAGNTTASAGVTYVYDGRGRMIQAGATTYLVNGLGQRVKKSTAGIDTYFAYDEAGHLIGEYDTSGAPIEETIWLGDLPVAVVKPNTASFDVFYVWADHLGSPRLITDAANQSRWEWPNDDPFGNNAANENPGGLGSFAYNLRFPGQYFDQETGKHYNYFRDYDSAIGRYIESDPIGLTGGVNTYAYVEHDPLSWLDPEGLARFNVREMRDMISRSNFSGFSNELILCIAWNESNFDPFRVSGTGPRGLMMVSPIAVQDLNSRGYSFNQNAIDVDPEANIGAGTAYLGLMQRRWKGKQKAIHKYGTGDKYPVLKILECEKCVQRTPPCKDSINCLEKVHK